MREKVLKVISELGIKGPIAAKAMGIKYSTFSKNKNEKELRHNFNKKNYSDLVNFLFEKITKLKNES